MLPLNAVAVACSFQDLPGGSQGDSEPLSETSLREENHLQLARRAALRTLVLRRQCLHSAV